MSREISKTGSSIPFYNSSKGNDISLRGLVPWGYTRLCVFGGVVLPCRSAENPAVWVELNDHRLSIEDQTRKLFRNGIVSYRM